MKKAPIIMKTIIVIIFAAEEILSTNLTIARPNKLIIVNKMIKPRAVPFTIIYWPKTFLE